MAKRTELEEQDDGRDYNSREWPNKLVVYEVDSDGSTREGNWIQSDEYVARDEIR